MLYCAFPLSHFTLLQTWLRGPMFTRATRYPSVTLPNGSKPILQFASRTVNRPQGVNTLSALPSTSKSTDAQDQDGALNFREKQQSPTQGTEAPKPLPQPCFGLTMSHASCVDMQRCSNQSPAMYGSLI